MSDDRLVVLALGANLGDCAATLRSAAQELANTPGLQLVSASGIYESAAVGGPDGQPPYLNAVVVLRSSLSARAILGVGLAVEAAHGRVRAERWGPRTLDVDLIAVGDETSADPELVLPHPRAHERGFVLVPWLDADPEAEFPGRGRVADLVVPGLASAVTLRRDLALVGSG